MAKTKNQSLEEVPVVRTELVKALADSLHRARFTAVSREEVAATIVQQVQAIKNSQEPAQEGSVDSGYVRIHSPHVMWFQNALDFYQRASDTECKEEAVVFLITASHDYCRSAIPDYYSLKALRTDETVEMDIRALEIAKLALVNYLSGSIIEQDKDLFHRVIRYLMKVEESGKGKSSEGTRGSVDAGLFHILMREVRVGNEPEYIEQRTRRNLLNLILSIHDLEETVEFYLKAEEE